MSLNDFINGPRSPSRVAAAELELREGDSEAIRRMLDVLQRAVSGADASEVQQIRAEWKKSRDYAERLLLAEAPLPAKEG